MAAAPVTVGAEWTHPSRPTLLGMVFDYRGVAHGRAPFFAGVYSARTGGSAKRSAWVGTLAEAEGWLEAEGNGEGMTMAEVPAGMPADRDERLDAAIAAHPQLWGAMVDAWRLKADHGGWDPLANGQALGFVRALGIVSGLDLCVIERRLQAAVECST